MGTLNFSKPNFNPYMTVTGFVPRGDRSFIFKFFISVLNKIFCHFRIFSKKYKKKEKNLLLLSSIVISSVFILLETEISHLSLPSSVVFPTKQARRALVVYRGARIPRKREVNYRGD